MNHRLKSISKLALLAGVLFLAACDELAGLEPVIASFSADPSSISAGEETTLSWNIIGGETDAKAVLTPGDVEVEKIDKLAVTPTETTEYVLSIGTSTKSLTVTVDGNDDTGDDGTDDGADDTGSDDGSDDGGTEDGGTDGGTEDGGTEDGGTDDGGTDGGEVSCEGQVVDIPDPILKEALQSELETDTITCDQLGEAFILQLGDGDPEAPGTAITDLTGLEYATKLESLSLVETTTDLNLAPILGLENLSSLSFEYNRPDDLSPLSNLPLTNFGAINALNTDFSSLDTKNLTNFSVTGFSEGPVGVRTLDLNDFADATDLFGLSVENVFVENQEVLANFTNMIGMGYNPAIPDGAGAEPIETFISAVSNYSRINNITYEPTLVPPVTQEAVVVDFAPWADLTTLEILNINVTNEGLFEVKDLEFTSNFNDLYILSLQNAGVTDITPLIGLPWAVRVESRVDLTGNPDVPAEQIEALREKVGVITDNE